MKLCCLLLIALAFFAGCSQPTVANRGGVVLVYRLAAGEKANPATMAAAIQARLSASGFKHANATADSAGDIRVELPGAAAVDAAKAKELIAHHGIMEFRILAQRRLDDEAIAAAEAQPPGAAVPDAAGYKWVRCAPRREVANEGMVTRTGPRGDVEVLVLVDPDRTITGNEIASVSRTLGDGSRPCISGSFRAEGGFKMGNLTQDHLKRPLGIIFDDELLSAPVIQSKITRDFQLTGNFTQEDVDLIVAILKSGPLPGRLEATPVSEELVQAK